MMSMASARRRAEQFAVAADGFATTALDAETQTFLQLVEQLRTLEVPAPDPAFTAHLRTQLMAAAGEELVAAPISRAPATRPRSAEPRSRRIVSIAASVCIVMGSGMGVAAASQSALPGDALYPLKRGIENVAVSIASGPADRGHEYVVAAGTRLTESQALVITRSDDPSTSALVSTTLGDFRSEAQHGADELITAYNNDRGDASILELRNFANDSAQQLQALGMTVPSDVRRDVLLAARKLTFIDKRARVACSTCSALAPITLSGQFSALQHAVKDGAPWLAPGLSGQPGHGQSDPTSWASTFPNSGGPQQHQPGQPTGALPTLPTVSGAPGVQSPSDSPQVSGPTQQATSDLPSTSALTPSLSGLPTVTSITAPTITGSPPSITTLPTSVTVPSVTVSVSVTASVPSVTLPDVAPSITLPEVVPTVTPPRVVPTISLPTPTLELP
jgi:Domain of unknown function (DUF5667)